VIVPRANAIGWRKGPLDMALLGNTWVDEACPPRRRVAATSSRQCGWPCPSRPYLLAPAWPRTCYILSIDKVLENWPIKAFLVMSTSFKVVA